MNNNRNPTGDVNLLDRAIRYVSPKWFYERSRWRQATGYDGANINRNAYHWLPFNQTGEQTARPARPFLRARARDMERNSDVARSIIVALKHNVVGPGFNLQMKTEDEKINALIEKLWREWCEPRNCEVTGQQSFREILNTVVTRTVIDGGCLALKTYVGNKKFPFQLQMREVDDIDSLGQLRNKDTGNIIADGVELNQYNKPIAFWLKETDPNGEMTLSATRVDASRVIFLWQKERFSEYRGHSQFAPIIDTVHDLYDYIRSVSYAQKILAAICVFIKKTIPDAVGTQLGRFVGKDEGGQPIRQQKIKPGQILELQPGEDISAVTPSGSATDANAFMTATQRRSAAALGLSLEATARDVSQVNYSSARQNYLNDIATYEDWQIWLIDHFLKEVFETFLISAVLAGTIEIKDFWTNKDEYMQYEFIPRGFDSIDQYKDAMANKLMIETHQVTYKDLFARNGKDYKEQIDQMKEEQKLMKDLEVVNDAGTQQ
jgi:lambda family phage portal protein